MTPPTRTMTLRLDDGLRSRIDAAVEQANAARPEGAPKVNRNAWMVAAAEAQLADRSRPRTPIPLGPLPEPRAELSPPMAGPPAARPRRAAGLPVYEIQHRQVASTHQWRLSRDHIPRSATSRMTVTSDARALLRERGIEPPFEVKLVPWVE